MGTLDDQYLAVPQPPFLFDPLLKQQEFNFQLSYEWLNDLCFNAWYQSVSTDNIVNAQKTVKNTFSIGFTYGL